MHALDEHIASDGFRLRGTAMSRVDAFSDVVFGFAITLLVVSLEVPRTFEELNHSLRGFIPFGICFLVLLRLWYSHYKFFRRYGLHDLGTISINGLLLFVVLFYVYPLKFLFSVLVNGSLLGDVSAFGTAAQMREVMLLYGVGFTLVYALFAALYWNAWRQRQTLDLNPLEGFLTRSAMIEYSAMGCVGLISILIALLTPRGYSGYAGFAYFLLWVVGAVHRRWEARRRKVFSAQPPELGDVTLKVHG
jgi:uncharacterized membrane protein